MSKYYDELLKLAENNEKKVRKMLEGNYIVALADIKQKIKVYMENNENLTYAQQVSLKKLEALEEEINNRLKKLYDSNYKIIKGYDVETFNREYFGIFYQVEGELKINLTWGVVNDDYIKKAIEMPVEGLKLSERLYNKYLNDMRLKIKGAVTQGIIQGLSYVEIAQMISNLGLIDLKHALLIAITEGGRIKSMARQEAQQEAKDLGIDLKKKWLSTLDNKTRSSHQNLDGQIREIDEDFEVNGYRAPQPRLFGIAKEDINCRCDTITVVEGLSPTMRRDNETKEIIEYKNYSEWYKDKYGDDYFKGGYSYSKDGIIRVTDNHKGEHFNIPRKFKPYGVIETSSTKRDITQIDRTFYNKNGEMIKQIHSGNHGNEKNHPYGTNGEHKHIYKWNGDKLVRDTAELANKDMKENKDIL